MRIVNAKRSMDTVYGEGRSREDGIRTESRRPTPAQLEALREIVRCAVEIGTENAGGKEALRSHV